MKSPLETRSILQKALRVIYSLVNSKVDSCQDQMLIFDGTVFFEDFLALHPVQVPRWPSNFSPGIKTKSQISAEKYIQKKLPEPFDLPPRS